MPPWLDAVISAILPPREDVAVARTLSRADLSAAFRPRLAHEAWLMAFFEYQNPKVRSLIRAVKFYGYRDGLPDVADASSDFLIDLLADRKNISGWGTPLFVPMPSSKKRMRERGYNQAERIAEAFLPRLGDSVQYAPKALARHDRVSQVSVERAERAGNIKDAFYVPDARAVAGKQIVLIDDVVETASTMKDARRALRAAGASDVLGISLAH